MQPYLGGEKRDFFRDFDDEELVDQMRASSSFREQFVFFASRTLQVARTQNRCADFLGAENLMVVGRGDSVQLRLIDYGILDLEVLKEQAPESFAVLEDFNSRLQTLLDSQSFHAGSSSPQNEVESEP